MDAKPKITWEDENQQNEAGGQDTRTAKEKVLDEWTRVGHPQKKAESPEPRQRPKPSSKKTSGGIDYTIDLHGKTLDDAKDFVTERISAILGPKPGSTVKIRVITGKGHHNKGVASVLPNEIQPYIKQRFRDRIIEIQDSPGDIRSQGVPIRGHFDITMR